MNTPGERAHPSVSIGIGHGEYVTSFDVNMEAIAQYLRDGGLTEKQIASSSVEFVDEELPEMAGMHITGIYCPQTKSIQLSSLEKIKPFNDLLVYADTEDKAQATGSNIVSSFVEEPINSVLTHELEHRICGEDWAVLLRSLWHDTGRPHAAILLAQISIVGAAYKLSRGNLLGTLASLPVAYKIGKLIKQELFGDKRTRRRYESSYEESRCRAAAEKNTTQYVQVVIKNAVFGAFSSNGEAQEEKSLTA